MHVPIPGQIKSFWSRRTAPGAMPGTVQIDPQALKPDITVMAYSDDDFVEQKVTDLDTLKDYLEKWPVTWVNIEGLGDADVLHKMAEVFSIHRLALEDVVNVHQRPKVEEYTHHLFIVMRMIYLNHHVESEQLSIFLGENYVLTFQSTPGDCLDPVRKRIREHQGRIRSVGADYLAYALIDDVIDAYFPVLDVYSNALDALEEEVINCPAPKSAGRLHHIKRNLLLLRRVLWPLREAVNVLIREHSPLITDETRVYLRDCYDHSIQIIDLLETYRELASSLMDAYLSAVSNRMNEIMKVLTIIATIFIPLSFIAGVYGMNFDNQRSPLNMPELEWYFGYPFALALMALVGGVLLYFFWRKGWLHSFTVSPAKACRVDPEIDIRDEDQHRCGR